jgi:hypothetical protein
MQRFFSAASQNRDRTERGVRYGPGSAAHHAVKNGALRRVRGTNTVSDGRGHVPLSITASASSSSAPR